MHSRTSLCELHSPSHTTTHTYVSNMITLAKPLSWEFTPDLACISPSVCIHSGFRAQTRISSTTPRFRVRPSVYVRCVNLTWRGRFHGDLAYASGCWGFKMQNRGRFPRQIDSNSAHTGFQHVKLGERQFHNRPHLHSQFYIHISSFSRDSATSQISCGVCGVCGA